MSTKITTPYFNCSNGNGCHRRIQLSQYIPHNMNVQSLDQEQLRLFLKLGSKYGTSRDRPLAQNFRLNASSSSSSSSPDPSPSPWKKWLWGILLTVILPAAGHKGGLLTEIKGKIDRAMETMENVTEAVEEIAEEAEKIMEKVEEKLPDDSELKKALDSFEDLAEKAAKEAKIVEDTIHKMKEVEEEIEEELMKARKDEPKK